MVLLDATMRSSSSTKDSMPPPGMAAGIRSSAMSVKVRMPIQPKDIVGLPLASALGSAAQAGRPHAVPVHGSRSTGRRHRRRAAGHDQHGVVHDAAGSSVPVAHIIGSGPATVLCDGLTYPATWSRPTATALTRLTVTSSEHALPLAAGQVWVLLVPR